MLLPPIQRTGEIQFYVAKGLPYRARLALAFGLMAAGFALQVYLLRDGPWALGLLGVAAGVAMLLSRGYRNVASAERAGEWRPARREDIERIIDVNQRQKRWDSDAIDITSGRGCLALIALGIAMFLLLGALERTGASARTGAMIAANAAVMLLPFWITGVRSILKNDKLVVKAKMFLSVEDEFLKVRRDEEEFAYQVQMAQAKGDAGDVPLDIKAIVQFRDAPKEFLGLQMQIAINSVQGTDYPYFYCVLVARPEFGSFANRSFDRAPAKVIVETSEENDAVVAVIRQQTTRNSGYHTKPAVAAEIFQYALEEARRLL